MRMWGPQPYTFPIPLNNAHVGPFSSSSLSTLTFAHNLILGCAWEYFQVAHVLAPFSFTPMFLNNHFNSHHFTS
jgi:hypothetical protein